MMNHKLTELSCTLVCTSRQKRFLKNFFFIIEDTGLMHEIYFLLYINDSHFQLMSYEPEKETVVLCSGFYTVAKKDLP